MKILILHNAYQLRGGEDAVVQLESKLLAEHDNLAGVHVVSNEKITGLIGKLITAAGVIFSYGSYRRTRQLLKMSKPDVVHVHNFFPLLSPSVFYACSVECVPVVFTLHNYRIVCPTALLMHEGQVTERSLSKGPWWVLQYKVYRGSWIGTLLLCLMIYLHQRIGTWRQRVGRFIVLSEFARTRFIAGGLPPDRLVVKPNFVDLPPPSSSTRGGLLFVGRLSPEKGIEVLLQAVSRLKNEQPTSEVIIRVVGDGPLASQLLDAKDDVVILGARSADEVRIEMQHACALLLPSVWYEGFPMVLVEAYANGLPVIASRIGALAELVEDGVTGLLFESGSATDMAQKMLWAMDHPEEMRRMGLNARLRYEMRYTPDRNYEQLMTIYRDAIEDHLKHRQQK